MPRSFAEWIADVRANAETRRREPVQIDDLAEIRRLEEMRATSTPVRAEPWLPDRMPTREQLQPDMPAVRIEPVCVSSPDPRIPDRWAWTWRCDCHPGTECAVPWAEKPAMESAVVEHDLMVSERTVGVGARWVR